MGTLSQKLEEIRKSREADTAYKLQKLLPYIDADIELTKKKELEAEALTEATSEVTERAKTYGLTGYSPAGTTPSAVRQHFSDYLATHKIGADIGTVEGFTPDPTKSVFENKASADKVKETADKAKSETQTSDLLGSTGKTRYDLLRGKGWTHERAIADAKDYTGLQDKTLILGDKAYKEFISKTADPSADPFAIYAEIERKYPSVTSKQSSGGGGGSSKTTKPADTKFKKLGLDPVIGTGEIIYKSGEDYYALPVYYDEEGGVWRFSDSDYPVNPNYRWVKRPSKGDIEPGVAPNTYKSKDGKRSEFRNAGMVLGGVKAETKPKQEQPVELSINKETGKIKKFNPKTGKFE